MIHKARKILGLDLGSDEVKMVELEVSGSGMTVCNYAQGAIPEGGDVVAVTKDLISKHGIRTKRCVTAVSGRGVIVRYMSMPKQDPEELRQSVFKEADKYIPFDISEVVLDCYTVEEEADGNAVKVLLVAVKRELIDEHRAMLKKIGLTSDIIDVDVFALGNSFENVNSLSVSPINEKVIALLDISASKSNVNIVRGETSYFTREVYTGGRDLTAVIAKRLGIEEADAEALKRNPGERLEEIKEYFQPIFEDLSNEVRLCFDYFENQFEHEVDEVYLSGGVAKMVGVTDILSPILERPVVLWSPIENMQVDVGAIDVDQLKMNAPQLAVAMGLASRITG